MCSVCDLVNVMVTMGNDLCIANICPFAPLEGKCKKRETKMACVGI